MKSRWSGDINSPHCSPSIKVSRCYLTYSRMIMIQRLVPINTAFRNLRSLFGIHVSAVNEVLRRPFGTLPTISFAPELKTPLFSSELFRGYVVNTTRKFSHSCMKVEPQKRSVLNLWSQCCDPLRADATSTHRWRQATIRMWYFSEADVSTSFVTYTKKIIPKFATGHDMVDMIRCTFD